MSEFAKALHGRFESLLSWDEFDNFWAELIKEPGADWYIYSPGHTLPDSVSGAEKTRKFLQEIANLLHKEHQERYCGIVYVDDKQDPNFIKIYDPGNLGVSCGYSDNPPPPGWILSKIPPENIDRFKDIGHIPNNRKHWWQRIFSHAG